MLCFYVLKAFTDRFKVMSIYIPCIPVQTLQDLSLLIIFWRYLKLVITDQFFNDPTLIYTNKLTSLSEGFVNLNQGDTHPLINVISY